MGLRCPNSDQTLLYEWRSFVSFSFYRAPSKGSDQTHMFICTGWSLLGAHDFVRFVVLQLFFFLHLFSYSGAQALPTNCDQSAEGSVMEKCALFSRVNLYHRIKMPKITGEEKIFRPDPAEDRFRDPPHKNQHSTMSLYILWHFPPPHWNSSLNFWEYKNHLKWDSRFNALVGYLQGTNCNRRRKISSELTRPRIEPLKSFGTGRHGETEQSD